jgi:hypothetical protein
MLVVILSNNNLIMKRSKKLGGLHCGRILGRK